MFTIKVLPILLVIAVVLMVVGQVGGWLSDPDPDEMAAIDRALAEAKQLLDKSTTD